MIDRAAIAAALRHLTPDEQAELDRLLGGAGRPVVKLSDLRIRTKDKRVVPFAPNAVQRKYLSMISPGWSDGHVPIRGLRELILKARQFGFSTLIAALYFLDTVNNPNTQTVLVASDLIKTQTLFQMVQRFQTLLAPELRMKVGRASVRELWWPEIDSYFVVGTAGSKQFGRGGTINNVHISEAAFCPNYEDMVLGLLEAVPSDGNVIEETTANGALGLGQGFHDDYQLARIGQSEFVPRFFPWFEHDEYQTDVPEGGLDLSEEDAEYQVRYALTDRQMAWYVVKHSRLRKKMNQEHPPTPEAAFLNLQGMYWTDWDDDAHVCPQREYGPEWAWFAGLDWGIDHPFAFILCATDGRGRIRVVDEVVKARLTETAQAQEVLDCITRHGLTPDMVRIAADPMMFPTIDPKKRVAPAKVQAYWDAGLVVTKADNNRLDGWGDILHYLLKPDAFQVTDTCVHLLKSFPNMVHDPKRPEDILKVNGDDPQDGLRYAVRTWMPVAEDERANAEESLPPLRRPTPAPAALPHALDTSRDQEEYYE